MLINRQEIIRYLGYGKNKPDEVIQALIETCIDEVKEASVCRHISRRFDVSIQDCDNIYTAGMVMKSRHLAKNLAGCEEVILFAATLGNDVDRIMNRYSKLQVSKAVVFQATAAAYIEAYCNECQLQIAGQLKEENLYLRPRYSPGYGDLSLSVQSDFLHVLDAQKTTGIVLSDGGVMIPEKSVTAVMGISKENTRCHIEGCETCQKKDCLYKR